MIYRVLVGINAAGKVVARTGTASHVHASHTAPREGRSSEVGKFSSMLAAVAFGWSRHRSGKDGLRTLRIFGCAEARQCQPWNGVERSGGLRHGLAMRGYTHGAVSAAPQCGMLRRGVAIDGKRVDRLGRFGNGSDCLGIIPEGMGMASHTAAFRRGSSEACKGRSQCGSDGLSTAWQCMERSSASGRKAFDGIDEDWRSQAWRCRARTGNARQGGGWPGYITPRNTGEAFHRARIGRVRQGGAVTGVETSHREIR